MALFSLRDISLSFSGPMLLDKVGMQVEQGEKVCIVGRNGEGKSTLLKIISRQIAPDSGEVVWAQGLKVGMLPQEVPTELTGSLFAIVASGLGEQGQRLGLYHELNARFIACPDSFVQQDALDRARSALDGADWELQSNIDTVLSHLKLNADDEFSALSGGSKRRVLLARALVASPDVLLLDEPTNHLDIESIIWLEDFLQRNIKTLIFITHDRSFLRRLATRIVELDRGQLADWTCDYDTFLQRKQALLDAEQEQWKQFDKKLAEEEVWIRKGIKARRTRNEGRVRALKKMREQRRQRRERTGEVSMQIQQAQKSGKLVAEVQDISFAYNGHKLVDNFSTLIMRGDRIGIIGPNGVGKTTLINILFGRLASQNGQVRLGTNLEVAYFDQLREQLDESKSVKDNVADGNDWVEVAGNKKHVLGYLKDFLFVPERSMSPVSVLSGGERNRLLLARLFLRPSNVLIMDEPTNDLDMETLELLEEKLLEFSGTLIVVSHDRDFLNNVVTSTLAFEGQGKVSEYVGGYDDWLRQRPQPEEKIKKKPRQEVKPKPRKGLSFKQQWQRKQWTQELAELPAKIEDLEIRQDELNTTMSNPDFYKQTSQEISKVQDELNNLEAELEQSYERWEFLEQSLADEGEQ